MVFEPDWPLARGPIDWVVGPGAPDNRPFGELLEDIRVHNGRSRADVAAEVGLTAEYVRLIETGQRTPALGQMPALLQAYGADGAVEQEMPDGSKPDLVLLDAEGDPHFIAFTSRIREARRRRQRERGLDPDEDPEDSWDGTMAAEAHAAELGLVVLLLSRAGPETLQRVRQLLEAELT